MFDAAINTRIDETLIELGALATLLVAKGVINEAEMEAARAVSRQEFERVWGGG